MSDTTVKICRYKGNKNTRDWTVGECYLLEIMETTEDNGFSPNGIWRRIIVNYLGKTQTIYKTFNEFLKDWDIIG
jgi:hypothetical protein